MSWWDDWGPALPVEGGLVATGMVRGTRIAVDARGVGAEIVTRMVERVNSGLASRGRAYARGGQTVTMTIEAGRIHALIQGSGAEPYSVTIACTIPAEHRARLIAAFEHALPDATKGIPARGTPALREEIDACELLVGVSITAKCTCPYGAVCKHCIALAYVAADRLDGSPIAIANFFGVRDEDLGLGEAEAATDATSAVPVFDSKRQAQLARTFARLEDRDPPTLDDVLQRAIRTLTPTPAILGQLGLDAQ